MHIRKIAIDMPEDSWDVNVEYEKLFGSAKRVNLFDTEEEYDELRQYIMADPQVTYVTNKLPFEGVEIAIGKEKYKCKRNSIKNSVIGDILCALIRNRQNMETSILQKASYEDGMHLFFIQENGVCDARGYYNEEQKYFYICKDSLVSYDTDLIYMINDKEKARINFLKKICEEENGYYRVIKDAKCRSALAAACYVLGRESEQDVWKDANGKSLSEVYPDLFSISNNDEKQEFKTDELSQKNKEPIIKHQKQHKVEVPKNTTKGVRVGRPPRYYYISRENIGNRSCNAKGEYDKTNDKFTILAGSVLASDVISSYRYTASDIKRRKFIQQYCGPTRFDCKMRKDGVCNSPDEAACFVLGENANGWAEWKSKEGISLESYISKV